MNTIECCGPCGAECWAPNPEQLRLGDGEIHVWRVSFHEEEQRLDRYDSLLSSDEKARAKRFLGRRERNGFVITRGILRELLGSYLNRFPATLEFECNVQGKPFLSEKSPDRSVQFNVSHSRGLALLAFSRERRLGVDVEFVQPDFAVDEVARQYFSPQEVEELRVLSPSLRAERFFLSWTSREAYCKARGEGLQLLGEGLPVSGRPERFASSDGSQWSLRALRPDPRYVGALVAQGWDWSPRVWAWGPAGRG